MTFKLKTMIEIGDQVYYRYRIGMFPRTFSGEVLEINDGIAKVKQSPYGNIKEIHVNILTKKKY